MREHLAHDPMNTLSLDDVAVRFGRVRALDGLTLRAEAGSVVMLAGPNGAGKSTLIRVLLGLVSPDRGTIAIDGARTHVDRALRERIGYLPESVAFAESLTGREVIAFFASARGVARSAIDAVLERVGIAYAARRAVRGYSRGMRQRLGLAVALVATPEILVLDEPTGGLDQDGLTLLWSVLDEWRAARRIVLLASHEIALLEHRVDRLALLSGGKLVAEGTPAALRKAARLPLRVHLELEHDEPGRADALLTSIRELGRGEIELGPEALSVDVDPGSLLPLLDLRARHPGAVRDVRVQEPPFDEVYRRLLQEAA